MPAQRALSFEDELAALNFERARFGYLLVAALMPAGVALDLALHPDRWETFLTIRLVASAGAFVLWWACRVVPHAERSVALQTSPAIIAAVGVEVMVIVLGPATSPYYAGLSLCVLALAVLHTWRWPRIVLVSAIIIALWVVPAIPDVLSGRAAFPEFFNNLYFLVLTMAIAVPSTELRYRAAKREFATRGALATSTKDLASALEAAKEVDRLKNEFFANISHELRTPLTLIIAPVERLLGEVSDAQVRGVLETIRRNSVRLLRMIDDLLDLARLEMGGVRLRVSRVDLPELARRVVDLTRPSADAKGVALELVVDEDEPPLGSGGPEDAASAVYGDPHRLEIVLTNLVSNALKFTPAGGSIRVEVIHGRGRAQVQVADTGPGIAPADQERIFERFYQVQGSDRRAYGGAGIGLALARELMRLHGGDITVESELGAGSVFTLALPRGRAHFRPELIERRKRQRSDHPGRRRDDLSAAAPGDARVPTSSPAVLSSLPSVRLASHQPVRLEGGRRPRIVVAEDERDLRAFLVDTLGRWYDVEGAENGAVALAAVRQRGADLVLSDVMMPGTSGLDLCRDLKGDPTLQRIPVILLTAKGGADPTIAGYEAGADDYVAKPFHTGELLARIRAHLQMQALHLQLTDHARLATAGTLAAGVAHEVRNPINAVLNAVAVLERGGSKQVPNAELLRVVSEGARRIDEVLSALDAHARPADGAELRPCDVHEAIASTLRLLQHRAGETVVHTELSDADHVLAPARAFHQVLLNLLDNALRSGATEVWVKERHVGAGIEIAVEDDGPGVPADIARRIFDPFFTTRGAGVGTGLGLYLSRRLAREAGGDLHLESRSGGGARFVLTLPALERVA